MLTGLAQRAVDAPRRFIVTALLAMVAAAVFGIPVVKDLSAAGFQDPGSESSSADNFLASSFSQGQTQMLITLHADEGVRSPSANSVGTAIVRQLQASPNVVDVVSAWTSPPAAAAQLISRDGRTGLIVVGISGGDNDAGAHAEALAADLPPAGGGVTVRVGGEAMTLAEIKHQSQHDLRVMESIAIPMSFLVLVWVFGGLVAAAVPVGVGMFAIFGSMAVLRALTFVTQVSIFALNLCVAMGLALAIDYTLLLLSRYREEIAAGFEREQAVVRTMATAGRTVLFSALTVALSMSALVLFPMYFLKSFAYAGVAVVAFAVVAALVVTPAAIMLLGPRLDAWDLHRLLRRIAGRPEPEPRPVEQTFWYRLARFVMRRAIPIGVVVVALFIALGLPFSGVKWGVPDDRVLPRSASAREVGDALRAGFDHDPAANVVVLMPGAVRASMPDVDRYAAELSRVADVSAVSAPTGTYVAGVIAGPPSAPTAMNDAGTFLTVSSTAPLFSEASETQLARLRDVRRLDGQRVMFTGTAQVNRDTAAAVAARLPVVLVVIAGITFVLLFLLTGSVILPLKALVLNVLSLTAAFGALVWIFQDGHLGALGTTATGTLVINIPVLLFCIAFGLSMDYEVFLVSRIREYWLSSGQTSADNDESVALGVAHTARVVTAAALIMSISFAALIAAHVSFMRMFGVGLVLAVLADATLVRMLLVPAFMHVMGRINWWAPKPLARLHRRIGIDEVGRSPHRSHPEWAGAQDSGTLDRAVAAPSDDA